MPDANDKRTTGGEFMAYTPLEGAWPFTRAATREEALHNLLTAISLRKVLCFPVNNPISTVLWEPTHDQH